MSEGCLDRKGNIAIPPRFDFLGAFSEGRAPALMDGRWGVVDIQGDFTAIPFKCKQLHKFSDGLAQIRMMTGESGFINHDLNLAIEPIFEYVENFRENLSLVREGNRFGFIDMKGQTVIEPQFELRAEFSNGLASVRKGDSFFFIDKNGAVIFGPFDSADSFGDNVALVIVDGERLLLNRSGELVRCPDGMSSRQIASDLFYGIGAKGEGVMTVEGEFVVPPVYKECRGYSEEMIIIQRRDDSLGFYSLHEARELSVVTRRANSFSEGLARIAWKDRTAFIDKFGDMAFDSMYATSGRFSQGRIGFTMP